MEPIVYWVDSGVPEPVKSALIEGALWWNQAFEAAGYKDAFQVKVLSADADPMDIRYNVIQWVHRSTAVGHTARVSEIHVRKNFERSRHPRFAKSSSGLPIVEGLIAPYDENGDSVGQLSEFALARIRQLSCMKSAIPWVLRIIFSSADGRASVMDYPTW